MEITDFLKTFASCFEDLTVENFSMDTEFQDMDDWTSMTAVLLIAKIEEVYNIEIETEEIRDCDTLQELFDLLSSK